jgi:hypothetical protein
VILDANGGQLRRLMGFVGELYQRVSKGKSTGDLSLIGFTIPLISDEDEESSAAPERDDTARD